jgi:exopolysaccharide biosynthesis polyprenyl glycosylphosphotransferase
MGFGGVVTDPSARTNAARLRRARRRPAIPLTALGIDLLVIAGAAILAVLGRNGPLFSEPSDVASRLVVAGPVIVLAWVVMIYLCNGYNDDIFGAGPDEFMRVLRASLYTAAAVGIGCYLVKFPLSRGFFLILFVIGVPALLATRILLRRAIQTARRRGALGQRVLLSGSPSRIDEMATVLSERPWLGYHVVGALTPSTHIREETPGGVPILGNLDDVTVASLHDVDVFLVAGGTNHTARDMRQAMWSLEHSGVQLVIAPSVTEVSADRMKLRSVGGLPLVHVEAPTWHAASRLGKRLFDLTGALALLVAATPVLAVSAIWIKVHDRGPVLFRQRRVGRDGHEFDVLKLRSMVPDAEERLADLHVTSGHDGGLFKLRDDPRVTRPGRLLRQLSVDELPQLVNVLRGEMSLVGPRPPLPEEVGAYDDAMARRLHVRPGITGLWQVSGRSNLDFEEAIQLDLYYVDNWSMFSDLSILVRTIGAVLRREGAY